MVFTSGRRGEPFSTASWRLYSSAFSAYFPRSDAQIRKDLAGRWLMNLPGIFACIQHKLQRKADEVRRSQKFYGWMGSVVGSLLIPMIASANPITWITEFAAFVTTDNDVALPTGEAFDTFVSFSAILGGEPGAVPKFTQALFALYDELLPEGEIDPRVRFALQSGVPELVEAAIQGFGVGTAGGSAISGGVLDALTVQNLASDVVTFAVRQLANAIRAVGAREVSDFYDIVLDLKNLPTKMLPFILWAMKEMLLDEVMEAAAQEAGIKTTGDADLDIVEPIREEIRNQGEVVPVALERPSRVRAAQVVTAGTGLGLGVAGLLLPFVFGD